MCTARGRALRCPLVTRGQIIPAVYPAAWMGKCAVLLKNGPPPKKNLLTSRLTQFVRRRHNLSTLLLHVAVWLGLLPHLALFYGGCLFRGVPGLLRTSRLRHLGPGVFDGAVFLQHRRCAHDVCYQECKNIDCCKRQKANTPYFFLAQPSSRPAMRSCVTTERPRLASTLSASPGAPGPPYSSRPCCSSWARGVPTACHRAAGGGRAARGAAARSKWAPAVSRTTTHNLRCCGVRNTLGGPT